LKTTAGLREQWSTRQRATLNDGTSASPVSMFLFSEESTDYGQKPMELSAISAKSSADSELKDHWTQSPPSTRKVSLTT